MGPVQSSSTITASLSLSLHTIHGVSFRKRGSRWPKQRVLRYPPFKADRRVQVRAEQSTRANPRGGQNREACAGRPPPPQHHHRRWPTHMQPRRLPSQQRQPYCRIPWD